MLLPLAQELQLNKAPLPCEIVLFLEPKMSDRPMQHCESRRGEANTNTDCCGSVCDVLIVGEVLMCYVNILRRKTTNEDCTNIRATTHRTIETRAKLFSHASGEI